MKGFGQIAFRIWLCVACAQAFILLAFFNSLQEARLVEVQRQLRDLVSMVLDPASAKASFGFPLRYQANLQKLLDRLTRADPAITLHIVDIDGVIIFSSDQVSIGSAAPAAWIKPAHPRDLQWSVDSPRESAAAARIRNSLGQTVGTIVARTSRGNLALDAFLGVIFPAKSAILFVGLMAFLAIGGVILAVRPLADYVARLTEGYRQACAAIRDGKPVTPTVRSPGIAAAAALLAQLEAIDAQGSAADRYAPDTDGA